MYYKEEKNVKKKILLISQTEQKKKKSIATMGKKKVTSPSAASWIVFILITMLPVTFLVFSVLSAVASVGINIYDPFSWALSYMIVIAGLSLMIIGAAWFLKKRTNIPDDTRAGYYISTISFYAALLPSYSVAVAFLWTVYSKYGHPSNHYTEPDGSLAAERWMTTNLFSAITSLFLSLVSYYYARAAYAKYYAKYEEASVQLTSFPAKNVQRVVRDVPLNN